MFALTRSPASATEHNSSFQVVRQRAHRTPSGGNSAATPTPRQRYSESPSSQQSTSRPNLCAPNELFSGPRGLGLYPPKGKARRRRRRRPCPPQAPPEALPAAGVRRRVLLYRACEGLDLAASRAPAGPGSQCGPQSSRARPASGWARGDSDSAFPASTNQGRLGGATLWYRDPKRRASPVARS
jgi:hypothetical protein